MRQKKARREPGRKAYCELVLSLPKEVSPSAPANKKGPLGPFLLAVPGFQFLVSSK